MNIFVVISKYDASLSLLKEKLSNASGARQIVLCPIHADLDAVIDDLKQFIQTKTSAQCSVIPFSRRLLEHSLRVKDQYIQFISDLGNRDIFPGVGLKQYFQYHSEKYSVWWLSLVYEKSPGKSDAFLHFVKVSLIKQLSVEHHCQEIWLSAQGNNENYFEVLSSFKNIKVESIGSRRRSSSWAKNASILARESLRVLRYFGYLLAVWGQTRKHGKPVIPANVKRFAVTMFPFFDEKQLENKKFYSKAYGPLQDFLEADKKHPVVWLAMHIKIEPYTWKESFQLAERVKTHANNFFSLDEWIGLRDILKIDLDFLWLTLRFIKVISRIPALTVMNTAAGESLNLWPFLREDFISSFAGKVAVVNLHYLRMFQNVNASLPENSTVIHFAEMHGWERSLQMTAKSRGDIKVIALQHAHVPQLLLNYFDHNHDLKDEDFLQSVPQPDALGSVGSVIQGYFSKQEWPSKKLFVIGGFRFYSLVEKMQQAAPAGKKIPVLIAAFSICYPENLEMLRMLHKAFNDGAQGIKVLIKSHPAESVEKMSQKEGITLNQNVFGFSDAPLEQIVPASLGMFACSTSAVFYAMACRKPVIVPCQFDAVDLCPLTNLYSYESRVDTVEQLKSVVHKIISSQYDSKEHDQYWNALLKDYLGLDKNFREHFEKLEMHLK